METLQERFSSEEPARKEREKVRWLQPVKRSVAEKDDRAGQDARRYRISLSPGGPNWN